jgi:N-acetylmuramoyl-L-alanine amidase
MKHLTKTNIILYSILTVCLVLTLIAGLSKSNYLAKVLNANANHHILMGKVIFIDPGHGGKDNGTQGDEVLEDEINLIIAKKLYEKLVSYGAVTYISRVGDYDLASLYAKNRKDQDMLKRVNYINSTAPDLFMSIHLNYYPNPNVSGSQVFYNSGNEKAYLLATTIQSSLNELNSKPKVAKTGDYYLTNKSFYPGVIIECGFLSNYHDRKELVLDSYQNTLTNKIIEGIINYFSQIST